MNPVLCVRNDPDDTFGITVPTLSEHGLDVMRLDGFDAGARWPALDEIAGLMVFGGEMNVDQVERHPYLLVERQLMKQAVDAGVPVLGICLGAQMLARALGARVYRAPVRELGIKPVALTDAGRADALLNAFADGARVFQWHEDTFELPAGALLLARGDDVAIQAFRAGPNAWGMQFHFEVDEPVVDAWLSAAGPRVERVWKRNPEDIRAELRLHLADQERRSRLLLAAFAAEVKQPGQRLR